MSRLDTHRGFSLVELLVTITVIGLLVALGLPAIQAARVSARRNVCQNRLRQQALAVLTTADANGGRLPALWRTDRPNVWENFSWRVDVLGALEQQPLRERLDLDALPFSAVNLPVAATLLTGFQCPATPAAPRRIAPLGVDDPSAPLAAGACDYAAVFDVYPAPEVDSFPGAWCIGFVAIDEGQVPGTEIVPTADALHARTQPNAFKTIRDGLSRTALLVEQAGKPVHYEGRRGALPATPSEGAWATAEMASYIARGIGRDNLTGAYSFHESAGVALCDGSVRMLAASAEPGVVFALLTRSGDEIIGDDDWR